MLTRNDPGFLQEIRQSLYSAVLSDVLDELGFRDYLVSIKDSDPALVVDPASRSYFLLPLELVTPLLSAGLGYDPRGLGAMGDDMIEVQDTPQDASLNLGLSSFGKRYVEAFMAAVGPDNVGYAAPTLVRVDGHAQFVFFSPAEVISIDEKDIAGSRQRFYVLRILDTDRDGLADRVLSAGPETHAIGDYRIDLERPRDVADARERLEQAEKVRQELETQRGIVADRVRDETAATQKRLDLEKQVADVRKRAADEAIAKANQEIDARRSAIRVEQDRLKSAEQRFGQQSPLEQRRLIDIMGRAQAGKAVSNEEMQALSGVGTRSTSEITEGYFGKRAWAAGFGKFGKGEREETTRLLEERRQLEVKVKDQRALKVTVEADIEKTVSQVTDEVNRLLAERDRAMEARIREKLRQDLLEVDNRNTARINAGESGRRSQ